MRIFQLSYVALFAGSLLGCGTPNEPAQESEMAGSGGSSAPSEGGGGGTGPSSAGTNQTGGNTAASGGKTATSAGAGAGGMPTAGSAGAPSMPIPVGETPEAKWVNVTNNLAGMPSECGTLGRVSAHPTVDL